MTVTDIWMVKTLNSTYEIKVVSLLDGGTTALCQKLGMDNKWYQVKADNLEWLERLIIGASFDVPGVVQTSNVTDYTHFVPAEGEEKRKIGPLQQAVMAGLRQQAVEVEEVAWDA